MPLVGAGVAGQLQGEADHVIGHGHPADDRLQLQDLRTGERGRDGRLALGGGPLDDLELFVFAGVVDVGIEHETVQLRFRQRISAFLLDGILRGEHEERLAERMPLAADRDLVLLHRLQQRGLGFRRGAVDLVGQDHVGEDRAAEELATRGALKACLPG